MIFNREQRQVAYKKLPPQVQSFIMDNETDEIIHSCLNKAGLREEEMAPANIEISNSLIGLQTLEEAVSNIAELSNKTIGSLSELKSNLEDAVFRLIPKVIGPKYPDQEKNGGVGNDFEQIILNQARAMRPARPASDLPDMQSLRTGSVAGGPAVSAPDNLPIQESNNHQNEPAKPHVVHNYATGQDPYREPTN